MCWTPINCAANYGRTNTVEHLLIRGAHLNVKDAGGMTPLHYAAQNGHTNTVEHLLNRGADINTNNIHGWTPLRSAENMGSKCSGLVALLKSKGGTW